MRDRRWIVLLAGIVGLAVVLSRENIRQGLADMHVPVPETRERRQRAKRAAVDEQLTELLRSYGYDTSPETLALVKRKLVETNDPEFQRAFLRGEVLIPDWVPHPLAQAGEVTSASLRARAEDGDADAQLLLARIYARGQQPMDKAEAARWNRRAAEQGAAEAQVALGLQLLERQFFAEAARWFRRAALQGDARAQNNLGIMSADGRGVAQDDAEAVRWYRLAALQGDADAQFNLGFAYADGRGVAQDDAEAVHWFRLAAEQSNAWAQDALFGLMYLPGRGVAQDDAEAVHWFRLAALQGDADAQFNLGFAYADGRGVAQDDAEAVQWFRLAAGAGHRRGGAR